MRSLAFALGHGRDLLAAHPAMQALVRAAAFSLALLTALVLGPTLGPERASADPIATVSVVLKKVRAITDDIDDLSNSDFFWRTIIAGRDANNQDSRSQDLLEGRNEITPHWEMSNTFDRATGRTVQVSIWVYDEDDWFNGGDNVIDISSSPTSNGIALEVDLDSCNIRLTPGSGVFDGGGTGSTCGRVVSVTGDGAPGSDGRAFAEFAVNVTFGGGPGGTSVRCLHTPLIPSSQGGWSIVAEALSATGAPIPADEFRIWVQYPTSVNASLGIPPGLAPQATCPSGRACTFAVPALGTGAPPGAMPMPGGAPPPANPSRVEASATDRPPPDAVAVSYRCAVAIPGSIGPRETTWRTAPIGLPPGDGAIPVVRTGYPNSRIDYIFVPDQTYEGGFNDLGFQTDVREAIRNSFYAEPVFLENQGQMNFFISRTPARAADTDVSGCDHEAPEGWDDTYSFVEAGAFLHVWEPTPGVQPFFRDCAPYAENYFSAPATAFRTILHETGHRPFALADEYCCDGGYHSSDFPNIYSTLLLAAPTVLDNFTVCQLDAPALGRAANACRIIQGADDSTGWSTSEPATNDLMTDNQTPQAADLRAIRGLFRECMASRC